VNGIQNADIDAGMESFMRSPLKVELKIYQLAKSWCNNSQQYNGGTYTQTAKTANRTACMTCTVGGVAAME